MQLSSCHLFQGLSESQINHLKTIGNEMHIQAGEWLYHEGDTARQMYILKDGAVEMLTTVGEVELPITIVREPGNCFGTSARCAEDGTVVSIKKEDFDQLINADVELGQAILMNLARHFRDRLIETRQELKIHFKTIFKSMLH